MIQKKNGGNNKI